MNENTFKLPIGYILDGSSIKELPIAETGGEAEKIYLKKPSATKLYTWFGQVIAISVASVGDHTDSAFSKVYQTDKEYVPQAISAIPLIDAGSVLMQVQKECWEDNIKGQRITCVGCGQPLVADIDLNKIAIPEGLEVPPLSFDIKLPKPFLIQTGIEVLAAYEGYKFNYMRFRVPTLGDAIRHEKISKDDALFWRNIAYDCLIGMYYKENAESAEVHVPEGFNVKRGMKLFSDDLGSKALKAIRAGLQTQLPSVKYHYEEDCPNCGRPTPFYASVSSFFST